MRWATFFLYGMLMIVATQLLSCKKDTSCEGCNSTGNRPPVAIAGDDQQITLPTDSIRLNGSASYDQDGKITTWRWTKVGGPASVDIRQKDAVTTLVKALVKGQYQFELTVTDDKGVGAKDTVQITVETAGTTNGPPVACAGIDQTITLPAHSVWLNGGCSTDPDGNIISYAWSLIGGPTAFTIANATMAQTQVSNLVEGSYQFGLKVTDAGGLFSLDTVQVFVNNPANNTNVDIYVAGVANQWPVYWKNGQQVPLYSNEFSTVTSIAVVGSEVYAAGWQQDQQFILAGMAKYWKNGQEVLLTGSYSSGAASIAVAGGDVYVAGFEMKGSKPMATYWKNGQAVALTDGSTNADANSIVVVGGDLYVAGTEGKVAKYWKNGQSVALTDGSKQANATSITVIGNDVYVAGQETKGTLSVATYWKNGQPVALTNSTSIQSNATSIVVIGNDVYVAGWEGGSHGGFGGTGTVAKYWKNGQAVSLTNGTSIAYATSIAVVDNDVYVSGIEINGFNSAAKYWKNGQPVILSGVYAEAYNIQVVKR